MNARITTLKQALRDDPRASRAYTELIQLLFESGKRSDAEAFARAHELPPNLRTITDTSG